MKRMEKVYRVQILKLPTEMTALDKQTRHHIKGTAVRNFQRFVNQKIGEAYFIHLVKKVELSSSGKILPSSWYPVDRYIAMHELAAEASNMSLREFVIEFTRFHLEIDMNGVYRFFMKVGGAQRVLSKVPSIDKAYSDYTRMSIESNDLGICISKIHVPSQYSKWYIWTLEGGFMGVLNVCGKPMKSFKRISEETYQEEGDVIVVTTMEIQY